MSRDYNQRKRSPIVKNIWSNNKSSSRPDSSRAITTSSRNRQSNSIVQKNFKLRWSKYQLNLKTSTKILANQTQIVTKTQLETTSHTKPIIQTRDNENIKKTIKRKDTNQEKLYKPTTANSPEQKPATKCPFTRKQQTNTLFTTQIHSMQIHKDDRNKRNTSSIKVQHPIRKRSKPSILLIDKTIHIAVTIYYVLMFFISCYSWISGFSYRFSHLQKLIKYVLCLSYHFLLFLVLVI